MRYYAIVIIFILSSFSTYAQKYTISGHVRDEETNENLIGATIANIYKSSGTVANTHGFYSLTLPTDSVTILYSYVGYQPKMISLSLRHDTVINTSLKSAILLNEVIVNGTKADAIHESSRMSSFSIPVEQIKSLPAFFGETDILKIIQLMPGVQSGSEGSSGLYVRGGGPDQNLILIDGVPVYNVSHLFGFFSIFNADAVNHVEMTKGGFPARFGGRLSSVIDINMKDGNMKKVKGEGSIGLISTKVMIEGPIVRDKTSFIISARRTYIDALAQPIIRKQTNGTKAGYYFYDFNFKINHIINPNNRLYASTYFGNDKAYAITNVSFFDGDTKINSKSNFNLMWGNIITALRWNHVLGKRLFSNITGTYSRYLFDISQRYNEQQISPGVPDDYISFGNHYMSGIRDWTAKIDFDFLPNPDHIIRFGANNTWHRFSPGVYTYSSSMVADTTYGANITDAYEISTYAEDDWKVSETLKINAGVHGSAFMVENKWYYSLQPRFSSRYLLTEDLSLMASFSSMTQYIHLLTNAGTGLPTDLWVPSTARIKPQRANQFAVGLAKTYKSRYEFSLEGFHKKMSNQIEYKDGASYLNVNNDWQDNVAINGKGKSYGVEILLQKKSGFVTGWLGYTLSKTTRQFDDLNFGKIFPYKYDRRHDVSLAISHEWNKRMDFSMVWVYGTGNAITLPRAIYQGGTNLFPATYYGDRNSYRLKDYHRLDLSFSWWKEKKWGRRKWTLAVYNVYSRLNPFFVNLERKDNFNGNYRLVQYSLFPIIPSITYSFKF